MSPLVSDGMMVLSTGPGGQTDSESPAGQRMSEHAAKSKVMIVIPHIKRRRELWRFMGDGRILRQSGQLPSNSETAPMAELEPRRRDADIDSGCAARRSPRGTDEPRRGRS
jgi:hypothetical protein